MLKNKIKKLKEEGKSVEEIAAVLLAEDSTKELKEVVAEVRKELKALELLEAAKSEAAKQQADDELSKRIADEVKNEMKNIKANPAGEVEEVKVWNPITGTCEGYKKMPEAKKRVADMFFYKQKGDIKSLDAVMAEIAQEEKRIESITGIKTALYSDVTTGSYTIPSTVNMEIMQVAHTQSDMYARCNKKAIVYNSELYPVMGDMTFAFLSAESSQLGDKTPTISNPTVSMSRFGGLAYISNTLIQMRSPQVVDALIAAAGSETARFLDLYIAAGSVTTESDPFNGIIFDANTAGVSDITLLNISEADFVNLVEGLSTKITNPTFFSNRKVRNKYGLIKDDNGNRVFPLFMANGGIAPLGYDYVENRQIPSTLTINSSSGNTNSRAGGTSDVLVCADLSKVAVGVDTLRIDMSDSFKFDYDQMSFRFINRVGAKVLSSSSTAGAVASVIELTN